MKLQFEKTDDMDAVAVLDPQNTLALDMEGDTLFREDLEPIFANYETQFSYEDSDSFLNEETILI